MITTINEFRQLNENVSEPAYMVTMDWGEYESGATVDSSDADYFFTMATSLLLGEMSEDEMNKEGMRLIDTNDNDVKPRKDLLNMTSQEIEQTLKDNYDSPTSDLEEGDGIIISSYIGDFYG